ncbi:GspH/FimT family pseudopilin [Congregibacter litoralis]|uniref:Type II secretion system protein H n=1 Tax=Congregibacter litoralis KT71 TaxID=314285 RepID=A4ADT5_9GAMM|nr:GspH/FimT family pseudopilin [Congregibacter litoralis]EAQ95817.1 prepilin-type N-terminal cleavage/methylation domain protein [Congregibacter litoralis KT71]
MSIFFPHHDQKGFTLIELMITLVVLAILLGVGVPSFNLLRLNSNTAALANDFASALNLARSEAVTRAEQVEVCPSSDGATCTGNWTQGWIVIVSASSEVLRAYPAPPQDATITQTPAANTAVAFGPLGQPVAGATDIFAQIDGCLGDRARQIETAAAGRVSVARAPCI